VTPEVIAITVRAVFQTKEFGCVVFVGNDEKVFVIHVDPAIGVVIDMFLRDVQKERPLTHDLIGHILKALETKIERVIINDLRNGTYFARLILRVENEVHLKVMEIDARPSDCIALATQAKAPLFVTSSVWKQVEDMSEILESLTIESEQAKPEDSGSPPDEKSPET